MIEKIEKDGETYAIILRAGYSKDGASFFTPGTFSQQLGYMKHPSGHVIKAHTHNLQHREIRQTQEVLVIRRGRLQVNFYGTDLRHFRTEVLEAGDVMLLASGGHGFKVLEEIEMIEIKQGPYMGDRDKTVFRGIEEEP